MSTGVPTVNVTEAQGYAASSTAIDNYAVVVGCTSTGSGVSTFFQTGQALVAARGRGDTIDTAGQMIEQRQNSGQEPKVPVAIYSADIGTPATYGTIDVTGFTGLATVAVDAASLPYGTYEAGIRFITAGIVGVTGITYQTTLDGFRTMSRTTSLGTAASITIPNSRVKFDLSPSSSALTTLNTLLNEIKTDFNAHVIVTAGTVHTNSGVADVVATATATNTATRIALANALRLAMLSHFGKGSTAGTPIHINVAGDTSGIATLSTTPAATDDVTSLNLSMVMKAVLNLHDANVVAHTIADATNVVTSATPTAGSVNALDSVTVRTFAPAPAAADLYDGSTTPPTGALWDLAQGSLPFSLLVLEFPLTAAMAVAVTNGLNAMAARGKVVTCLARSRTPDFEAAETEQAWSDAIALNWLNYDDSRISVVPDFGLITDALTGRIYRRSRFAQVAAEFVAATISTYAGSPNARPSGISNVSMVDSGGNDVGHDEGPRGTGTGLANFDLGNRFMCFYRDVDERVWLTVPSVLYGELELVRNVMTRRTVNAIKRVARAAAYTSLGGKIHYNKADPNVPGSLPTLPETTRIGLQGVVFQALAIFGSDIDNTTDGNVETGLVQIGQTVTVTGGNLVAITITVAPQVAGYVIKETIILAVQE